MAFQIHSASKITHVQAWEQVESMIKSGKVENQQTNQASASFCFSHQIILLRSVGFFPINLKPLLPVFLNSHRFSPIAGSYFHHCDVIMHTQKWLMTFVIWFPHGFLESESQSTFLPLVLIKLFSFFSFFFCKKIVNKIYEWLLKLCEGLLLSYSRGRLPSISF